MQSEVNFPKVSFQEKIKNFSDSRWNKLSDRQKIYAKKAWSVITYKWRWQIAMNVPYLTIFLLDRTIPAVHQFDMAVLASVTSKLPIPSFLSSLIGIS